MTEKDILAAQWKMWGEYYGYPACCIEHFITHRFETPPSEEQSDAAAGTGFIPCPEHTRQILEGHISLQGLVTNRHHPSQFPQDRYDDEVENDEELITWIQISDYLEYVGNCIDLDKVPQKMEDWLKTLKPKEDENVY